MGSGEKVDAAGRSRIQFCAAVKNIQERFIINGVDHA
jgi:hypothetical protein